MEAPTRLSGVTSAGISPGWGTVTLLLALEDGQAGARIQMTNVLYIPQSPASLVSLHKLNNAGLYWDNKSWHLCDDNDDKKIVGYTPKWRQSWILQLVDTKDYEIAVGIIPIGNKTYQWPLGNSRPVVR